MCGLAGFLDPSARVSRDEFGGVVKRMADTLVHRGPDDGGTWVDAAAGIALGHRRLSIVDLSQEGHQPMASASGRYRIAFNGEIYNHADLRAELAALGFAFRGHSDTEVMLAAFEAWGIEPALRRFIGMFAFALWDGAERRLYLARDRLGEKPLYYGSFGRAFVFASELKALRAHPDWHAEIDRDALTLYLRHSYIPAPYSIYKGIRKLAPGHLLWVGANGAEGKVAYWPAKAVAEQACAHPWDGGEAEAAAELERLLLVAVKRQMVADVPLGAMLSGGIDSSAVVALMQAQSDRPVRTFTIGFNEQEYNEATHAKAVARHLGTDHRELYVTPDEARAVIPRLPAMYDEPFSDASQIPTFLVSRLARRDVTVSLSGDGGDELFGGYPRYFWGRSIWRNLGWLPAGLRRAAARALTVPAPGRWEALFRTLAPVLPARLRVRNPGDKVHKLAELLKLESGEAVYRQLVSHWTHPAQLVTGASEPPTAFSDPALWARLPDFAARMMYLDAACYLPDDILTKVDRASMAVSLEVRVPLLDHNVVEFAWRVPSSMKMRDGQGKWLLRQVLYRYVPPALIERPKMGFSVPIDLWLRGPLRDWAEALLDEARLKREEFFDPRPIRRKWEQHLSGRHDWQYHLWDVLMFQAWREAAA